LDANNNLILKKEIEKAKKYLSKNCEIMKGFIKSKPACPYEFQDDLYFYITRAIVYQQVSTKAAATIFDRFQKEIKGKFTAKKVLALSDETMQKCGLSRQKRSYIKNIAQYKIENPKLFKSLFKLSNEEIIENLTEIKGVGEWTVQMMLIFAMGRLNVFPEKDLAVMKSFKHYYKITSKTSLKKKNEILKRFGEYSSVASWYLWRAYEDI